jgi:ABC-type nitrate/sulfonate/bicarbonate transport system permease component
VTATAPARPAKPAHRAAPTGRGSGRLARFAQSWAVFVVAVALWQLLTAGPDSPFFPPPTTIATTLWRVWFDGPANHLFLSDLGVTNMLPSLERMLGSWAIAAVIGVALGIALGRSARALDYLGPLLAFFRAIPPPVLAPVFLLLFNLGAPMQIATIIFGVVWPVIMNTTDGARSIDPTQYETARSFRLPRRRWVFGVVLPAALPKIFAGLRVSLSLALILMVISELLGATDGIGYQLSAAKNQFDYPGMWAIVVMLGILGYLFNTILLALERRVLRWQPGRK